MLGAQMIEYNNYELHYNLWVEAAPIYNIYKNVIKLKIR